MKESSPERKNKSINSKRIVSARYAGFSNKT
jgi:hypothetical protein